MNWSLSVDVFSFTNYNMVWIGFHKCSGVVCELHPCYKMTICTMRSSLCPGLIPPPPPFYQWETFYSLFATFHMCIIVRNSTSMAVTNYGLMLFRLLPFYLLPFCCDQISHALSNIHGLYGCICNLLDVISVYSLNPGNFQAIFPMNTLAWVRGYLRPANDRENEGTTTTIY